MADKTTIKEKVLLEQIEKVRDVDSESIKPKVTGDKIVKRVPNTLNPGEKDKERIKAKAAKPAIKSQSQAILDLYSRNLLRPKAFHNTSTFTPSPFLMFEIVHQMDDLLRRNFYFKRHEDAWHPFISRIYFGILFIIRVIQVEIDNDLSSPSKTRFFMRFTEAYPPETLPVPSPLVTLFEALDSGIPSNSLLGPISPQLPDIFGPEQARDLINFGAASARCLLLPNIPMLVGFANTIITAQPNAIPDYSKPGTFDNTADRVLNGHAFAANNWTDVERSALLTPGLIHRVETDLAINTSFNAVGFTLELPPVAADTDISSVEGFTLLQDDISWFGRVLAIMNTYCSYFREPKTLAECKTSVSMSPVITTHYTELGSTYRPFSAKTLTHAFPAYGIAKLSAFHSTKEENIPPAASILAECAQLNVSIDMINLGPWSLIGDHDVTRFGPYWTVEPTRQESPPEVTYQHHAGIIGKDYSLTRPSQK